MHDLIDNTGANRNRIRYDSFGNITNQTNPALTFRFGYTGRDFDSETGLSYYRARYYDARVGRFLSEDPIGFGGGDANLYRYVGNSPANYTDPSGMIAVAAVWAAIEVADTAISVSSAALDLYRIYNDNIVNNCGNLGENLTSLGLNLAGVLPFVPALGAIGRGADDAADAFRNLDNDPFRQSFAMRGGAGSNQGANYEPPSPALRGNPYDPDVVEQRIRPPYRPNPAHDPRSPLFNPRKTPEPGDSAQVYSNAIRGDMGTWYGVNQNGEIYRFFTDNAGGVHFSGIVPPQRVPNDVLKQIRSGF